MSDFPRFPSKKSFDNYLKKNPNGFKKFEKLFTDDIIIANSEKINKKWHHPYLPGYTTIVVLTKSYSIWGNIGPYCLRTKEGYIFENYWQFCKVYEGTPKIHTYQYGRHIWSYDKTDFLGKDGEPNDNYWKWRKTGFEHNMPVRYPVYKNNAKKCLYSIPEDDKKQKLGYIEARKEIYFKKYIESLHHEEKLFSQLQEHYKSGMKLILTEVDGVHREFSQYYKNKYKQLKNEPLEHAMINATKENLRIMVNDPVAPIGHIYPLAIALKEWSVDDF